MPVWDVDGLAKEVTTPSDSILAIRIRVYEDATGRHVDYGTDTKDTGKNVTIQAGPHPVWQVVGGERKLTLSYVLKEDAAGKLTIIAPGGDPVGG